MKTKLVERVLPTLLSLEDLGSTMEGDTLEEKCFTKLLNENVFERKTSEWDYPARESLKERTLKKSFAESNRWRKDLFSKKIRDCTGQTSWTTLCDHITPIMVRGLV